MKCFRNKMITTKPARRSRRSLHARWGRRIELLEDRSMLSASIGGMAHGAGSHAMLPQHFDSQHSEPAMFGGPPRAVRDMDHAAISGGRFFQDSFGDRSNATPSVPIVPQRQTTIVIVITIVRHEPVMAGDFWYLPNSTPSPTNSQSSNGKSSSTKLPLVSAAIMAPPSAGSGTDSGGFNPPSQIGTTNLIARAYSASLTNVTALSNTALTSLPTAAQIVSAQANSAARLPTSAVDAALQSYSGRLLLAATSSGDYGRVLASDVNEAAFGDRNGLNDFIELDAVSLFDDPATPQDAIERERAAVNAVLGELHDLDSLPWDAMDTTTGGAARDAEVTAIELQLMQTGESAVAEASLADAEGGMVMLETRSNPNDSVFDLVGAAAEPDLLRARTGLDAAVGFYQAIDVATDEVPTSDVPATSTDVDSAHELHKLHRASSDQAGQTTGGTAAAVGATLLGGLLWLGRGGRSAVKAVCSMRDEKRRPR